MKQKQLPRPKGVILLAWLFILAPIGNVFLSLAFSGVENWYSPTVALSLLASVAWLDWLWLSLLVLTGFLLFLAHKTAWALAVLVLLAVIAINLHRAWNPPIGLPYSHVHVIVTTAVTFAVLVLAFYFRYPYLDRRARWFFPTAHRYDLQTNVQVVANDIFDGVTESISMSGARLRLKRDLGSQKPRLQFVDVIYTQIRNLKISCEVVEYSDNILRVRHKSLSLKDREILGAWLQSQNEAKTEPKG